MFNPSPFHDNDPFVVASYYLLLLVIVCGFVVVAVVIGAVLYHTVMAFLFYFGAL